MNGTGGRPPGTAANDAAEIERLHDYDCGVWFVATASDSAYVLNLDRRQVMVNLELPKVFLTDRESTAVVAIKRIKL